MNDRVNVPLLRKAVEWAEVEATKPFEECMWYQGTWVLPEGIEGFNPQMNDAEQMKCGTAYCIAGFVANITLEKGEKLDVTGFIYDAQDRNVQHASKRAAEVLGLGFMEADALFASGNTIEQVREIAEGLAGEKL